MRARADLAPQVVPETALVLTCGVDVQKYGIWFLIRAWAAVFTSWLIHYGFLADWVDLEEILFKTEYPQEGTERKLRIWRAGVDTGGGEGGQGVSKTEETYFWLRRNAVGRGCRVWGTKGSSSPLAGKIHVGKQLDKTPSGRPIPGGLQLIFLDTGKLKDTFHFRLQQAIESNSQTAETALHQAAYLHAETNYEYVTHILAEEKRRDRKKGTEEWVQVGRENHLLDCEIIAHAHADPEWPGGGVNLIRPPSAKSESKQETDKPREDPYLRGRGNPFARR